MSEQTNTDSVVASPAELRKLLDSAAQKAEAAWAVLADRRCAAHDAIPLLHLGWSRLFAALGQAAGPIPGLDAAESARAVAGLETLSLAASQLAETDPAAPDRRELRWLAAALGRAAAASRGRLPAVGPPSRRGRKLLFGAVGLVVFLAGGAVFALAAPSKAPVHGWRGSYFRNHTLTGPAVEHVDPEIAFFWDNASALPGLPRDDFTVRWDGCLRVATAGEANFAVGSDDESRVFVDGKSVVDSWKPHSMTWRQGKVSLAEGVHHVRVEYGEEKGGASVMLKLGWNGAVPEPIDPSLVLVPTGDAANPCRSVR